MKKRDGNILKHITKEINLSSLVHSTSLCPTNGSVYVFLNRSRTRMKRFIGSVVGM